MQRALFALNTKNSILHAFPTELQRQCCAEDTAHVVTLSHNFGEKKLCMNHENISTTIILLSLPCTMDAPDWTHAHIAPNKQCQLSSTGWIFPHLTKKYHRPRTTWPYTQCQYRLRIRRRWWRRRKPEIDIEKYDYKFVALFCIIFSFPAHFVVERLQSGSWWVCTHSLARNK